MRAQIDPNASAYLRQRHEELLNDRSIEVPARRMISVHMVKPWIPNFWSVAIRAPKPGSEHYFDFPIAYTNSSIWFFPSREWWQAHAHASHPGDPARGIPDGAGCSVKVHTDYLSKEGKIHEFDYATVLRDGTLKILGRPDFVEECTWWKRAF